MTVVFEVGRSKPQKVANGEEIKSEPKTSLASKEDSEKAIAKAEKIRLQEILKDNEIEFHPKLGVKKLQELVDGIEVD